MSWNGQNIKSQTKAQGLTLQSVSSAIGVTRQTINSWINGQMPRGEHLVRLCNVLSVEPNFFLRSDKQQLVSIPQHRTVRNRPLTNEMRQASQELAEQYVNLFRCSTQPTMLQVLRVQERNEDQAKKIAEHLRALVKINNDKPVDFEQALKLMNDLGIYTIFRSFPEAIAKSIYAFYCKICERRVVFINSNINAIDLIFYLLHETIHAVRDEKVNEVNEEEEENFCDKIASFAQFPDEYINNIKKRLNYFDPIKEADRIVKVLKDTAIENHHAIYGLYKRLVAEKKFQGIKDESGIHGADSNLRKKNFSAVNAILFGQSDARKYVDNMKQLSPLFLDSVSQQTQSASSRKIAEWLGLDNALDAEAVVEELKRG